MSGIQTVLVANRGEIAVRIICGCRKLGKRAVIAYHELDRDSLAVRMADASLCMTGPTPVAAYLSIDNILAACKALGADAVHPGFGFLAENAELPRRLAAEGIRFIGPGPDAIAAMGDKIQSKRLARDAGVNTIPGSDDALTNAGQALTLARDIGFPVILKASAGGGGKGMRVLATDDAAAMRSAFERTTAEAQAAFGDPRVFIEKYITDPRHIEIQVLADRHGTTLHLGERECSIQRRHQKIIEEAPSAFVDAELRAAMGAQAVALARAVGYVSAGTVEFVVDGQGQFYFLEMNTRIQVEHPVTEMVTGLDIVEQQIRIAEGEPLGVAQEDVQLDGHAIECRLCAEDPARDFLPATGGLLRFSTPTGPGIRLDAGVRQNDPIGVAFDPLLAKLIIHAPTRAEAIARMRAALDATVVLGVTTNASYLARVLAHPEFVAGNTTTHFLQQHQAALLAPPANDADVAVVVAAALLANRGLCDARFAPPVTHAAIGAWGRAGDAPLTLELDSEGQRSTHRVALLRRAEGGRVSIDGKTVTVAQETAPNGGRRLLIDGASHDVQVAAKGETAWIQVGGRCWTTRLHDPVKDAGATADEGDACRAPMPGTVVALNVGAGDTVSLGQTLLVMESMKMQINLDAARDGVVAEVRCAPGDSVERDARLVTLAPKEN